MEEKACLYVLLFDDVDDDVDDDDVDDDADDDDVDDGDFCL